MPTVAERLRHVTLKVERAKEHVADLEGHLRTFMDSNPYKVGTKHHPETRKLIYYLTSVQPTPEGLPLISGDVIQNLMSALDHLAYQLVCSDTGDKPPNPDWIYFPIRDTFDIYEAKKRGKMQGACEDTFSAIDALKPYKGGNDALWMLFGLNKIEKHRLLLTVGSQAAGMNVGRDLMRRFRGTAFANPAFAFNIFIRPSDPSFPLKDGLELFIGAVDEEPDPHQQFRFEVALNEPGICEGQPLLETLHQATALVEGIVTALTPRLKNTP